MAFTHIQNADNLSGTGSILSATFAATPTEGNLLIAAGSSRPSNFSGAAPTHTVSSGGNQWTLCEEAGGASATAATTNHRGSIWWRIAGPSEATVVTLTPSHATSDFNMQLGIFEFSADGTPTIDRVAAAANTSNTLTIATGTTGTLATADDLIASIGSIRTTNNFATLIDDASLTVQPARAPASYAVRDGYKIAGATTAVNITWSKTGNPAQAFAILATFTEDGGESGEINSPGVVSITAGGTGEVEGEADVSSPGVDSVTSTGTASVAGSADLESTGVVSSSATGIAEIAAGAVISGATAVSTTAVGTAQITAQADITASGVSSTTVAGTADVVGATEVGSTGVSSTTVVGTANIFVPTSNVFGIKRWDATLEEEIFIPIDPEQIVGFQAYVDNRIATVVNSTGVSFPGVVGNYDSTPDRPEFHIIGPMSIVVHKLSDLVVPSVDVATIAGQWAGGWLWDITFVGNLRFVWHDGGTRVMNVGAVSETDGYPWIAMTFDPDDGGVARARSWRSLDGQAWDQIATNTNANNTAPLYAFPSDLTVGARFSGGGSGSFPLDAELARMELRDGVGVGGEPGGTLVASRNYLAQQSPWTDPQGNEWTLNGGDWTWVTP